MSNILKGLQLNELSNKKLGDYKTAAGADASKADSEGDYKRGDKRMSGIIKATKKEFANDEKKKDVAEATGDVKFDKMLKGITSKKEVAKQQKTDTKQQARDAFGNMFGGGNPADKLGIRKKGVSEAGMPFRGVGGAFNRGDDERHDLDPSEWYVVKDGKMYKTSVYPNQVQLAIAQGYSRSREEAKAKADRQGVAEEWSQKYKSSINCSHPKGFSQKAHCAGKKKNNESAETPVMEMVCEDCGMCETHGDHTKDKLDELKCWSGFHRVAGTKAGFPGSCAKNKTNEEGVAEAEIQRKESYRGNTTPDVEYIVRDDNGNIVRHCKTKKEATMWYDMITLSQEEMWQKYPQLKVNEELNEEKCPHCNGPMFSELMINEKKDACYYKVKSRYKVWPSAYASGALVKCRKSGADSWGNGGKKNESSILEGINRVEESLHDWFNKEKWVRMDTKGNIKGPCAKEPGEGKPKCLPQAKAHSLGKKGRASAASRKRREDPNPERSGKAINVNTKKKSDESIDEGFGKMLGTAALAGSMALGAAGANARVTPDGQGGYTGGLKPTATQQATDTAPAKAEAPKGFSIEYLQKAADPNRFGRYMISVEKAQELLKQAQGQ